MRTPACTAPVGARTAGRDGARWQTGPYTRPQFRLILSTLCGIRLVGDFRVSVTKTGQVDMESARVYAPGGRRHLCELNGAVLSGAGRRRCGGAVRQPHGGGAAAVRHRPGGRGLHSSTSRLDVSTFCAVDLVVAVAKTAQIKLRSGGVIAPAWRATASPCRGTATAARRGAPHSSTSHLNLSRFCH